jgi:hypothetical protein
VWFHIYIDVKEMYVDGKVFTWTAANLRTLDTILMMRTRGDLSFKRLMRIYYDLGNCYVIIDGAA